MPSAMPQAYVIVCALVLAGAKAFVLTPTSLPSRAITKSGGCVSGCGRRSMSMNAEPQEGTHGVRSRFLPVQQLDEEMFLPRTVQVAGALGEVTVADIMAVGFTEAPEVGMWQYDFSDPEGPQMGTVAVPGSELVNNMLEPVAIVAPNEDLNLQTPKNESVEVLLLVDRANREFELGKFFLWDTDAGLLVRYFEEKPAPGFQCIGRVAVVMVPFLPSMARKFTGFEEEEY